MNRSLFGKAICKFLAGVVLMGLLLFLPAGTFNWWQGWLLMGILFVPMFIAGLVICEKISSVGKVLRPAEIQSLVEKCC